MKTHCKHGHEFTEKNTYLYKDGKPRCRECKTNARRPGPPKWKLEGYPAPVHCLRGHPFNKANTQVLTSGKQNCRMCASVRRHKNDVKEAA